MLYISNLTSSICMNSERAEGSGMKAGSGFRVQGSGKTQVKGGYRGRGSEGRGIIQKISDLSGRLPFIPLGDIRWY
jgi:hypothetical protein